MAATGTPARLAVTAPAYSAAVLSWLAAAVALTAAADDLASGAVFGTEPVLAAHLVGLGLFPFAVAAAVWQLLPVMLRNDPPTARARPVALLLLASGPPLAAFVALGWEGPAVVLAVLLACGLLVLLGEVASLVLGAPAGRQLVVSRPAVALAGAHAAIAFLLGVATLVDDGPEPLGVPYERLLLVHVTVALVGWLTILIAAVGRTLVPMLGLAAAAGRRRIPAAELTIAVGLWTFVAGVASETDGLAAAGIGMIAAGLAPVARLFAGVALGGKIGAREGPVGHVAAGLVFLLQAAVLGIAAGVDLLDGRRAAVAGVILVGVGWAAGVILGHLGKLVSLSGWGSWPPGPRPSQLALYPRRLWQLEVVVFAVGVQLLAAGVLAESGVVAAAGGGVLVVSALTAAAAVGETLRRVARGRHSLPG